jgi:hypothetical protein
LNWDNISKLIQSAEAILTMVAIIIGGFWTYSLFIRHRQKFPRAKIVHEVTDHKLPNNKVLLHSKIIIQNIGEVLISLVSGEVRILQMLPLPNAIAHEVELGIDPVISGRTEIDWPQLCSKGFDFHSDDICEIEPGETEEIICDFIIDNDISSIQMYSFFYNVQKTKKKIGWGLTTIHHISGGVYDQGNKNN